MDHRRWQCDRPEANTPREGTNTDVGGTLVKYHICQDYATCESRISKRSGCTRNLDFRQTDTVLKSRFSKIGQARWQNHASQQLTSLESRIATILHFPWQFDILKTNITLESRITHISKGRRQCGNLQADATRKCLIANCGTTIGHGHIRHSTTILKSGRSNRRHTLRNNYYW